MQHITAARTSRNNIFDFILFFLRFVQTDSTTFAFDCLAFSDDQYIEYKKKNQVIFERKLSGLINFTEGQ